MPRARHDAAKTGGESERSDHEIGGRSGELPGAETANERASEAVATERSAINTLAGESKSAANDAMQAPMPQPQAHC